MRGVKTVELRYERIHDNVFERIHDKLEIRAQLLENVLLIYDTFCMHLIIMLLNVLLRFIIYHLSIELSWLTLSLLMYILLSGYHPTYTLHELNDIVTKWKFKH